MTIVMAVFGNKKTKPSDFENWLNANGYFYMKTKDNRPCFESKLTRQLKVKYQAETCKSKPKPKIFSFKFRG